MNLDHIHANKSFLLFQASLEEVSKTTHGKMYKSTEVHMLVKMTQNMVLQDYKPYINDLKLCLFDCVWCYTISYLYCSLRQYNYFFKLHINIFHCRQKQQTWLKMGLISLNLQWTIQELQRKSSVILMGKTGYKSSLCCMSMNKGK